MAENEPLRMLMDPIREAALNFRHRRGSKEACDYADTLENGYANASDLETRREIMKVCDWLRSPDVG